MLVFYMHDTDNLEILFHSFEYHYWIDFISEITQTKIIKSNVNVSINHWTVSEIYVKCVLW